MSLFRSFAGEFHRLLLAEPSQSPRFGYNDWYCDPERSDQLEGYGRSSMSRRVELIADILLIASLCSACVPFPVAFPEKQPFTEASEEWLTLGESTADDMRRKLGDPDLGDDDWWLYREARKGWGWAFCVGGGYTAGCGALPRSSSDHFLLAEFDNNKIVTGLEFLTERELCQDHRICFSGDFLMRADTVTDDLKAKKFSVPSNGCSVYTYSKTDSDLAAGEVVIDGNNTGGLVGTAGFYLHTVSPGSYEWMVAPSQSKTLPLPAAIHVLQCSGQEVFFLRYRYGASNFWLNKLEAVEPKVGKEDIAKRWLAVSSGAQLKTDCCKN